MFKKILFTALCGLAALQVQAQEEKAGFDNWVKNKEGAKIEPLMTAQFWSVYSSKEEVYQASDKAYHPVEDRVNFHIRRARFGFRAQPVENLRFTAIAAFDGLGRDALTGTLGSSNNTVPTTMGIMEATMEWRMLPKRESLFLTAGLFRPQFSRESITSAWVLPSMEKSFSQNYVRRHISGPGLGRNFGANVGGILRPKDAKAGVYYNVGVFTPQYTGTGGLTVGKAFSPLWVGRLVFELGDTESAKYKISYDYNFFSKRKGLSIGINGATQGATDLFASNSAWGVDALFNWNGLNLDVEHDWLQRTGTTGVKASGGRTGQLRGSINVVAAKTYFLEPTAAFMFYRGEMTPEGQANATALKLSSGKEDALDIGINWHLQPKRLKVLLHYTMRWGDPGAAGNGSQVNAFFSENTIGPVHRGNWLGLGLNVLL